MQAVSPLGSQVGPGVKIQVAVWRSQVTSPLQALPSALPGQSESATQFEQAGLALPAWQVPAAQASLMVQGLPSSQGALFCGWVHPVAAEQTSSVHTSPSRHLELLGVLTTVSFVSSHRSSVQSTPSDTTGGAAGWQPRSRRGHPGSRASCRRRHPWRRRR